MSYTFNTMKDLILSKVDNYFLYEDLEKILPKSPKSSIMARVHELIAENRIERIRLAGKGASNPKKAIYRKLV